MVPQAVMGARAVDLVLTNGRITTGVSGAPEAQAIGITRDRIVAVGSDEQLRQRVDGDTQVRDLGGRRVIPGLIDSHLHLARAGLTWTRQLDWSHVTSLAEAMTTIEQAADVQPAGSWIQVVGGWHPARFAEGRGPTPQELTDVAPQHRRVVGPPCASGRRRGRLRCGRRRASRGRGGGAVSDPSPAERALRPRRSVLIVPASNPRMIAKARGLDADEVVLDLEDSVAASEKDAARANVVAALVEGDWGPRLRSVRINAWSTPHALRDVLTVVEAAAGNLDTVLVPKVRSAADVHLVDGVLRQLELELGQPVGAIGLGLQLEDAHGLVGIGDILAASERIETVNFGPGDLAAALGMPTLTVGGVQADYPGDHWHFVAMTLLVHARTRGVQVIDGPYGKVHDADGFEQLARRSRALGFDGKWVLHPSQIAAANAIYGVEQVDHERASDLLAAYAAAGEREGRGAVMFGDEMIDEASRAMAEVTVRKGRSQGLVARETPAEVPHHERARWREEHLGPAS